MAKVPRTGFHFLRRLSSSVPAEQLKAQATVPLGVRKVKGAAETGGRNDITAVEQKETFWMKDPKSGNWIPESHFGDIDVVELREKLLPKTEVLRQVKA